MKKALFFFTTLMLLCLSVAVNAQSLADYTVTTSTETYTSIADATLLLSSVTSDDGTQTVTLPFNFPFGENTYPAGTTLTVRADGYVYFGTSSPGHSSKTAWTNTTSEYYFIAPFLNYDGKITANGATSGAYCTTDNPDNPTMLIIEFKGLLCYYSPNGDYNFQLRLHSNGNISTVYGESTLSTYSSSYGSASQNFFLNAKADKICLTGSYAEPVAGTPSALPNFTIAPVAGQVITFVRPVISCPKPTGLAAVLTPGDGSIATLSWTKGGEETNWVVEYSTASDFTGATQVTSGFITTDAPSISVNLTGLTAETKYYARVKADCGGGDESEWSNPISFTPTDAYTITVYDSHDENQTSSYIPMYGNYFDDFTKSEFIIPATKLGDMQWGSIESITFYAKTVGTSNSEWYSTNQKVFVKEVNTTTLGGSYSGMDGATVVFNGLLDMPTTSTDGYTITFSQPYTYSGGNLLIGVYNDDDGSYNNVEWYGTSELASGVSAYGNNGSSLASVGYNAQTFLPKITFNYTPGVAPSCLPPTDLVATEDQPNQSELSWTANNNETSWTVYYKKTSEENYTSVVANSNPFTLPNLTAVTNYEYYVVANCSTEDVSDPSQTKTFRTACPEFITVPFTENFDSYTLNSSYTPSSRVLPLCWSHNNESTYSSNKWYPTMHYYSSTDYSNSSPNYLRFYVDAYSNSDYEPRDQYLILPAIQNLSGMRLKLYARANSTNTNYDATFKVGVMEGNDFVQVGNAITPTTTTYEMYTIPFSSYAGDGTQIAIMVEAPETPTASYSHAYRSVFIDDITVEEIPSCLEPSNLHVVENSITTNSVQLEWTPAENTTAWDIYYTTDPSDVPTASTIPSVTGTTDNPCTVGSLTHSSHYYAYVRTHCANEQSPWTTATQFITDCDAITIDADHHYIENFNSYTGCATSALPLSSYPDDEKPLCWKFLNRSMSSSTYPMAFISSNSSYADDGNCLFFKSSNSTPIYAILPEFTNNISDLMLTFKYRNEGTSSGNGTLYVSYMTDPTDASTFNEENAIECEKKSTLTAKEVMFASAPAGSYIAFKYQGGSSNNMYLSIDNVNVEPAPTCIKPSALACDSKTAHTATLSWTNGEEGQDAWQIAYSTNSSFAPADDFTPGENEWLVDVTTNPATLQGLDPNTTYYAYVRANCGTVDGISAWNVTKINFTTNVGNAAPTDLAVNNDNITSSQATVTWNGVAANEYHDSYDIYYATSDVDEVPAEPVAPNFITGITDESKTIEGLNPATSYKVWVRDNCGSDGYSTWAGPVNFTTKASCSEPENLVVTDVTAHGAMLDWTAGQGNDSYTLRYRKAITAPVDFDVTYDFEDGTLQGWTSIDEDGDGKGWTNATSTSNAHGGSHLMSSEYNSTAIPNDWLISPEIPLGGTLSFYAKKSSGTEQFQVYVSTTGTGISDFTPISDVINATTTYTPYEYDLSTYYGNGYVAIKHTGAVDQYWFYVDDIHITASIPGVYDEWQTVNNATKPYPFSDLDAETYYEAQVNGYCNSSSTTTDWSDPISFTTTIACPTPTNLAYSNVTAHTADLTWNVNGNTTTNYVLTKNGEESNIVVTINEGVASYQLQNLNGETEYTVSVKANCGNLDGYSALSNEKTFTTLVSCAIPTELAAIDKTTSSIKLHWTANNNESAWVVAHKIDGATEYTEVTVAQSDLDGDGNYNLTGLSDGKTYTIKVRANCGGYDGMSQWSNEVNFQTLAACPAPTNLAVTANSETAHGATITWDGNDVNDSYIIEYAEGPLTGVATLLEENFDDSSLPTGWNASTNNWSVSNSDNAGGDANEMHLYYNPQTTTGTRLVTPAIDLTGIAEVTFSLKHDLHYWSGASAPVTLGIATSSNGGTTWNEGWSQSYSTSTSSTISEVISTSDMGNTNVQFCIFFSGDSYNIDDWYFDDINITTEFTPTYTWNTLQSGVTGNSYTINTLDPETQYVVRVKGDCNGTPSPASNTVGFTTLEACGAPTAFILGDVEAHQASFSWTAGNGNEAWKVYVKKHSVAEYPTEYTSVTTAPSTENPVTINELDAATAYDVKIVPTCDENKFYEVENAFTTKCEAVTIPAEGWTEKFDSYTGVTSGATNNLPICWNYINGTIFSSVAGYPLVYNGSSDSYSGNNHLRFNANKNQDPRDQYAVLPPMHDVNTLRINLYARLYHSSYGGTFTVGVMTDPADADSFVPVGEPITLSSTNYTNYTINLNSYNGSGNYIAIKLISSTTTSQAFYIDDITVEPIPSCVEPSELQFVSSTTTTATLQWIAGGSETAWDIYYSTENVAPTSSTTPLVSATTDNPATINNLTASSIYYVWVRAHCSDADQSPWIGGISFTTKCDAITDFPITYGFETSEGFQTGVSSYSYAPTTNNLGNCWRNQATSSNGNNTSRLWCTATTHYDGSQSLMLPDKGSNGMYNTTLLAFPPMNFTSANGYHVSFWIYRDGTSTTAEGFKVYASNVDTIDANAVLLGHYSRNYGQAYPKTESSSGWYNYDFYIPQATITGTTYLIFEGQSYYGNSTYVDEITIEEAPACYPVGTLAEATNITATTADLSWTPGLSQETNWKLQYRVDGYEEWNTIDVSENDLNEGVYTLDQLSAETTYNWQVAAACGNTDISEYIAGANFTTAAIPEYTVTFIAGNSGTCNTSELTGVTVELPAATPLQDCAANGWTFAGWTTTELTENTTTAPVPLYEAGTSYTPSASILMYAVYMRTEGEAVEASYNLVTEEPNDWSGDYLIVYTGANTAFNSSLQTLDASSNVIDISNFLNNSSIASNATTDAAKVTIAAMTGGYSILAANGKYIGSKNNNDNQLASENTPILNTISLVEGNADIVSSQEHLRCNDNGNVKRFRYYKSTSYTSQNAIQLYKYTSATPVTYASTPDCSIPVSYNIIVTQVQGATITAPSTAFAGDVIQLSIDPEEGYALNQWQVTASTGPVTVNNNSFEMPAANVNVTATLFNVYTVTANTVPTNGGTVTGAGSYNENTEVSLTANANDGYDFTGWYNGNEQVSVNNTYTFTVTGNVTLEARFAARHTVTFNAGNGSCATTSLEGSTIDLSNVVAVPSALCGSQGWEFAGWSETSVDETPSAPVLVNTIYTPASDIDLYAVYKKTDAGAGADTWAKATSIAVGDVVVIVNENASRELTGIHSNNYGVATNYTTLPEGTYPLTVEQGNTNNTYAFKNNSNYLALTGDGNSLYQIGPLNNSSSWTVSFNSDGDAIIYSVNYTDRVIRYNSSSNPTRFACYKGSQNSVQLYKLIPGNVTTYNSNPNCVNSYMITAEANDATYGTVTGTVVVEGDFVSGTAYAENTGITLTATANEGYTFVNWTKGGTEVSTNATYSFTVTEAGDYVANFEINKYTITATANPTAGGSVEGAGTYDHGADVTLTATANDGYTFVNWTKGGTEVSTNAAYSFTVAEDATYVANFELNNYDITVSANPTEGGTVSGDGNFNYGDNVILTATANEGYTFVNWTKGGTEVSTNATYSFTVTEAGDYVANFSLNSYTITAAANPTEGGSVEGAGTYNHGADVTLTATANEGYTFVNWTKGGEPVSTNPTCTLAVTEAAAYVANFELNSYDITVSVNPAEGGSVTGAGTYSHGANVTLTATANEGYTFVNWTEAGQQVSTQTTYVFTFTAPRELVANFVKNVYTVTASVNPDNSGSITGMNESGEYEHGTSVDLTAVPATGYHFVNWMEGNDMVSTEALYHFTATGARNLVANFEINSYEITATANPTEGGTVSGAGTYNHGDNVTLTATANEGYTFTNWTENGVVVNATNPYEFQVTGERELVANFSLNTYDVTASANPTAGGTVTGAGTYNHGATVTMEATPAAGYAFVNWTEDDQEVSTDASYTFTFTEGRTLVANFTPITYTVTFNPGTGTCQTESLTGSVESSINIDAVTAAPSTICGNQDWVFAGWSTASVGETAQAPAFVSGTEYIPTDNIDLYAVYTKTEQGEGTWANATSIEVGDILALVCSTANRELSGISSGTSTIYGTDASYTGSPAGAYPLTVVQGYNGSTYAFKTSDNTYLSWSSGNSLTTRSNVINESSWNVTFASGNATISNAKDNSRKLQYNSSSPRFACYSSTQTAVQLYKYTASSMTVYNSNPLCYVYAVNVDQNIEHGSVVADPTTDIVAGTEITLTPTPETGYHFGIWNVTAGNDPVTVENNKFTMPESDVNVSALFWIDTLTVNVNANPAAGGTVSGAGDYEYGDMVTLIATANTGYTFVNWTVNNQEVSTDATYEFTFNGAAGTRTFVANFSLNSYEITVSANPTAGGTVNGGNTYNHGATAMLTATPSTGYHFVNWTKDNVQVSTDAEYSFTVAEGGAYVANFELNSYTIAATANPTAGGAVSGAGTYNHFDNVTLTATVSNGYDFIGWYRGNDQVATSLEYSFEATEDVTLEARFATRYTITFVPGSHSTSTIEPRQGSSVTAVDIDAVTADPSTLCVAQDWEFAGWSSQAIAETNDAPTTWVSGAEYYPTSDITLYAVYKKTEGAGNNTASIDFSEQGYTNGETVSSASIGNNITVNFFKGTNNNAPKYYSSGSAIRCYGGNTFTVTATETSITNITLTFGTSGDGNSISANIGTYNSNGTWTGNENSVTFTIGGTSGNRRIAGMSVTTFSGTITYNSDPECFVYDVVVNPDIEHGTVTADPNTGVIAGTEIVLTNTPSEGYHFAGWNVTAGNDPVTVENNKFLMPESDVNVSATFEPDTFTLTVNYMVEGGGGNAPEAYSKRLPFGTSYSVTTPVIAGLTPSQEVVSGTMPAHDVTVDVTYYTDVYTLTVHYVYADNTPAAEDAVRNLAYNVPYTVTSPTIEGYTPDQVEVSGTMGEANVEVTVVYSINSHDLTINYVQEDAGTPVAASYTTTLNYNDNYSVVSPQVAGYAADKSVVSGTMGDADKTETVTYYLVETSIVDATNCAGTGTGSLTVTAPTGNFEYSLDGVTFQTETQFANLNAGDYTLYIRPTGEAYNYSGVWTVNSNITMPVAVASANAFYCPGDNVNLSGDGSTAGSEYTYAWSGPNNFTANDINATIPAAGETHSGTYTLAVTNTVTNCVSEATVDVIVNTPGMNGYLFTIATHGDAYANLVNGEATPVFANPTVQHYLANAGCNVTLSNDAEATYHHAGDYTITWTAEDACGNTATTTQVLHVVLGTCPVATDYDGNTYPVVALNNLCWMAANLRTTHYSDSRPVPNLMVYSSDMYPDATANLDMFGYLYDWTAAMDAANGLNQDADGNVHGICPAGWRMPKENEIRALVNDGVSDIFDLRTADQWLNNFGTNTTGFSLLPAGCYNANSDRFENLHGDAYIWGVGASAPAQPRVFWADCKCYNWQILDTTTPMGYSVRCVKEN